MLIQKHLLFKEKLITAYVLRTVNMRVMSQHGYKNRYLDTKSNILLTFYIARKSTYFLPCTLISCVLKAVSLSLLIRYYSVTKIT
jgi:hypothetical protein